MEQEAERGEGTAEPAPAIVSVRPDALSPGLRLVGWSSDRGDGTGHARGMVAAATLTRSPGLKRGKNGVFGCVIASAGGDLVAGSVNSKLWASQDAPCAPEVPAEVRAVGHSARLGRNLAGGTAYTTAPLSKRTFHTLACAGLGRVVFRKPISAAEERRDIEVAARRLGITLTVEDVSVQGPGQPGGESNGSTLGGCHTGSSRESTEACDATRGAGAADAGGCDAGRTEAEQPAMVPPLHSVAAGALPEALDLCGWAPEANEPCDEAGLRLALLVARNSRCRNGSMGCAVVSEGVLVAAETNGPFWGSMDAKKPPSDVHAEVNAIGSCARRGVAIAGASVYITMPPCRRCFQLLAASGVGRIVVRKPLVGQEAGEIIAAAEELGIELVVLQDTPERHARVAELAAGAKRRKLDSTEDRSAAPPKGSHDARALSTEVVTQ